VAPLGIPVLDLLPTDLLLLVDEQGPEDDGPARAMQFLGPRIRTHFPALAAGVRPEKVRLGRVVGVEGAQEVEVRLGAQAVRLGQGGAVAELVGCFDVQQGVGGLLQLGGCHRHRCQDSQDHSGDLEGTRKESQVSRGVWKV